MGIDIRVAPVSLRTTNGTQDITVSGLGAASGFKGAWFFMTVATDYDTLTQGVGISQGGTDGTDHFCNSWGSKDAAPTSNCGAAQYDNRIINLIDGTPTELVNATFNSWITDGIRINVNVTAAGEYKGFVILCFDDGSDLLAKAQNTTMVTSPQIVTGTGFEPEIIFGTSMSENVAENSTVNLSTHHSFGHCWNNNGTIFQRCLGVGDTHNATTSSVGANILTDRFTGNHTATSVSGTVRVTAPTSDGFSLNVNNGSQAGFIIKTLSLTTNGALQINSGSDIGPTNTTSDWEVKTGFKPIFVLVCQTSNTVTANRYAQGGTNKGFIARTFYAFDQNGGKGSIGYTHDTNESTTNNATWSNQTNLLQVTEDDQVGDKILATQPEIFETGFRFPAENIQTANGTSYYYSYIALGNLVPIEVYPPIGGGARVMPYNTEFPWWEDFEEPQPKQAPPSPPREPTLSEQLSEIAGNLDLDAEDLRIPRDVSANVTLSNLVSPTASSVVEYTSDINLNSDLAFKVNVTHERWSDSVWVMRESIAAQNKQLAAILMTKLLD